MDEPLVREILDYDHHTTDRATPTLLDLIQENRVLVFRAALLDAHPHQALAQYFLHQNDYLKRRLRHALGRRMDRITGAAVKREM